MDKIERSECGSGGCVTCPFSHSDEAEMVQNYGCLPDIPDIIRMKEKSGHNWGCHYDETRLCGGFARFLLERRPDLTVRSGNIISYETWYLKGESKVIQEANEKIYGESPT